MTRVTIKNICNRKVGLYVADLRLHRVVMPGRTIQLDKELLEDALTYPGVNELFERKYLTMVEADEAVEMGLVGEDDVIKNDKGQSVISGTEDYDEIMNIIENGSDFQLKKLLKDESAYRKDVIVSAAAKSKNITLNKIQLIKEATGVDLQKIISTED